jgi:hypothetical protein
MSIGQDIEEERARLIKVTFGNKLAQKVTEDVLFPILNSLEEQYPYILDNVGKWLTNEIKTYMMAWQGTGRTYKIYEWNPDAPYGQRQTKVAEYTAGSDLGPPVSFNSGNPLIPPTGSLVEGIQYEINAKGYLSVGLLNPGFTTGREFKSTAFYGGKILIGPDTTSQPVHHYWKELNKIRGGSKNLTWFKELMLDLRKGYREKLRSEARKALNKATRRISVRRAIVFKVYFK